MIIKSNNNVTLFRYNEVPIYIHICIICDIMLSSELDENERIEFNDK